MATFVRVRNINPIGAVDVVDLYTGAKFTAAAGEVVDVDPETAGRGPSDTDLGYGLLAQITNWELAETPADTTEV